MTNTPFSFTPPDYYQQLQLEFAGMASDLRMLGFNETTIQRWITRMWDLERRKAIVELIAHFKQIKLECSEVHKRHLKLKRRAKKLGVRV